MEIRPDYIDLYYDYLGLWDSPSRCGLKIVRKQDETYVIATELYAKNPGTSVTNCITCLALQLCKDHQINPHQLSIIEHNPDQGSKMDFYNEMFFRVSLDYNGTEFENPRWEKISREEVERMIA
jgi:hypothetical protein